MSDEGWILRDKNFERLLDNIYAYFLKLGWNRIPAKLTLDEKGVYPEQSLLSHSINALCIIHRVLQFLEKRGYKEVSTELYIKALLVAVLHDVGKIKKIRGHLREVKQNIVRDIMKDIINETKSQIDLDDPELNYILSKLEEVANKDLDEIFIAIKEHQGLDGSALLASKEGIISKDFYDLYNLVLLGDVLAYYRDESDIVKLKQIVNRLLYRLTGKEDFRLTYYRITTLHGIVTQFLHISLEEYLTENFDNILPILYTADRTFFLIDGQVSVDVDKVFEIIISKIEKSLKSVMARQGISETLLIDNDKKYGLVIDPFLLLFKDIKKVMENAADFYYTLRGRVSKETVKNNEKKLRNLYSKYNVPFDATYDVVLISRMLMFYYRFCQDAEFLKKVKSRIERIVKLTKFLTSSDFSLLDMGVEMKIKSEPDLIRIVAGLIYEQEVNGKKIKEYENPFELVGQIIANAISQLNDQELKTSKIGLVEKYFKKQIGLTYDNFKSELKERIKDVIVFDINLVNNVDKLIQSPEYYISAKVDGSASSDTKKKFVCIICNLSGFGFPLKTQRSALPTRIFTNRNIASASLNVRWICAMCLIESILRALFLRQKINPDDKRIYIFMMPDVLYTRLFARTIYNKVNDYFGQNFMNFNISEFSESVLSEKKPEVTDIFSQTRNRGFIPLSTTDAHFIMFMNLFSRVNGKSVPDSYAWYEALFLALALQKYFGGKYVITESFVPPYSQITYTILLESPHSYIRRVLEIATTKKILDFNEISIIELENLQKLLSALYIVGDIRDLERRLAPPQEIPRSLKVFLDYNLPGSKFFAETLAYYRSKNRESYVRSNNLFWESCKILDKVKGGNLIEW